MRKHLFHFLLATIFMVGTATTAIAQTTVRGQVIDADTGEPLIGVTAVVEGSSSQGAVTDFDENFTLKISQGNILVFT